MPPVWKMLPDGRREASYFSVAELEESIHLLEMIETATELGGVLVGKVSHPPTVTQPAARAVPPSGEQPALFEQPAIAHHY